MKFMERIEIKNSITIYFALLANPKKLKESSSINDSRKVVLTFVINANITIVRTSAVKASLPSLNVISGELYGSRTLKTMQNFAMFIFRTGKRVFS
jgi:hypothetical protein